MSERKVLTKYYPPDFDPAKLERKRQPKRAGPKQIVVRLMAPFSMQCTSCGEFIYRGLKFNARKETAEEKYLDISIYRFYIRCPRCSSQITFKTDPKHNDYICEKGARRNFEPWREYREEETEEEKLDRLEAEAAEKEVDVMEELENKFVDAKAEMAVADALDEIRAKNARNAEKAREHGGAVITAEQLKKQEEEALQMEFDAEYRAKLAAYRNGEASSEAAMNGTAPPARENEEPSPPTRKWKPALSGIKVTLKSSEGIKPTPTPQAEARAKTRPVGTQPLSKGLGTALVGYDSDTDED